MRDTQGTAAASVTAWRGARRVLTARRQELGRAAARLYPGIPRAGSSDLLCRPEWLPAAPLSLAELPLHWASHAAPPAVEPAGPASAHVRPVTATGRYPSYAAAIGDLDRPALFENRVCYRLLEARLAAPPGLVLSRCAYFDAVNLGHALAHELAAAWQGSPAAPLSLAGLPLRELAGDPCDLGRRCAVTAITTLTLRRTPRGEASFVLHWRDPAKVNHAGGLYQVMPVGIFQPLTSDPASARADFGLAKSMIREYSEEFLGTSEHYEAPGGVFGYQQWPFYQRLTQAQQAGKLSFHCVGLGADPLTFATDLLAVAVFDGDLFDALFADLVPGNAEGRVVTENGSARIPFTRETIDRFGGGGEPVQAAAAAVLQLGWQHRRDLLA